MAKMQSWGIAKRVQKVQKEFYKKLETENKEAFEKLGSSSGLDAQFPKFPPELEEEGQAEIGSWMVGDPSVDGFESFLVAKFDHWKLDFNEEFGIFHKLQKLTMFVALPLLMAVFAKLAKGDAEGSQAKFKIHKDVCKNKERYVKYIERYVNT